MSRDGGDVPQRGRRDPGSKEAIEKDTLLYDGGVDPRGQGPGGEGSNARAKYAASGKYWRMR